MQCRHSLTSWRHILGDHRYRPTIRRGGEAVKFLVTIFAKPYFNAVIFKKSVYIRNRIVADTPFFSDELSHLFNIDSLICLKNWFVGVRGPYDFFDFKIPFEEISRLLLHAFEIFFLKGR